jgi:hypothetical protein
VSSINSRIIFTLREIYTNTIPSDDLTVEVIFFGNSEKSGDVIVNKEASALGNEIKAKL